MLAEVQNIVLTPACCSVGALMKNFLTRSIACVLLQDLLCRWTSSAILFLHFHRKMQAENSHDLEVRGRCSWSPNNLCSWDSEGGEWRGVGGVFTFPTKIFSCNFNVWLWWSTHFSFTTISLQPDGVNISRGNNLCRTAAVWVLQELPWIRSGEALAVWLQVFTVCVGVA